MATEIHKIIMLLANKNKYSLNMKGYKRNKLDLSIQVYLSIANLEKRRGPRGSTTHRIILKRADILRLANQFVKAEKRNKDKIDIRIKGDPYLNKNMLEFTYVTFKDYLKGKRMQPELADFRKYKNQSFKTMDIQVFC